MERRWFQIDIPHACAAICVEGPKVVVAAPIFAWMIGEPTAKVAAWLNQRHAGRYTVTKLSL